MFLLTYMATLDELRQKGVLVRMEVTLAPREFEDRVFYAYPDFRDWLFGPVMKAKPFDRINLAPRFQAQALLHDFVAGKPLGIGRTFKRMRPHEEDVFELVTPDLRVFGWFPQKDVFIAVAGDFMERTHGHDLYVGYRNKVVRERHLIDLDEPKWLQGASEYDVITL
ncbi:hypothetical protein NKH14_22535 [Mesorhizobium sp. M1380]|uniref:hypothetical protein n=1 Tax=Mesorhizobium sp. M1380 TaxID=2957093 RepID=UPI003336DD39